MTRPSLPRSGATYAQLRRMRSGAVRLRKGLRHVDPTAFVHPTVRTAKDLKLGPYAYVGPDCYLAAMTHVGAYTLLAPRVAVIGGDHRMDVVGTPIQFTGRPEQVATTIGRDAWVGYGAIISRGFTIGDGAIIGAGSIVTKDVPPYEVWVGAPAKKLRDRFTDEDRCAHERALDGNNIAVRFAETLEGK